MKNMQLYHQAFKFAAIFLFMAVLVSCNHDRNHPGWAYFPDMVYSEAYETYSPNTLYSDSTIMQAPVEGTIPRGFIPYPYQKTYQDQILAGQELMNPIKLTDAALEQGKAQYDIYCAICHGDYGQGDGHLYTSKKFTAKPTSLVEDYVQSKPDGEIYHIITMGSLSTLMGPHGSQITPENRWKIISYMKNDFSTRVK